MDPDPDAPPVQAVITESAEPVFINERRDTTEVPPLVAQTLGEVDVSPTPREIVDAKTSEIAPRTLQAALIADGRAAAYKTEEVVPAPKPVEETPTTEATRPTSRVVDAVAQERGVTPLRMPSES